MSIHVACFNASLFVKESKVSEDTKEALRWISYIAGFLVGVYFALDTGNLILMLLIGSISSFLGGGMLMIAFEVGFSKDENASPLGRAIRFFVVLVILGWLIWANN